MKELTLLGFGVEIIKDERGRLCLVVGGDCEKKQGRRVGFCNIISFLLLLRMAGIVCSGHWRMGFER